MIENLFIGKLQLRKHECSLLKNTKICKSVMIREFGLKLLISIEINNTMDYKNQAINKVMYFIKKDFIPIYNILAHICNNDACNITVSDFEFYYNQDLIGYEMLLDHMDRNTYYYNSIFY